MKIAAFVSSSSHHGNTATAVQKFLEGARAAGAETEIYYLHDYDMKPCRGCRACEKTGTCVIKGDDIPLLHEAIRSADAYVLATPTFYGDITGAFKVFVDRCYPFVDIWKDEETQQMRFGSRNKERRPGVLIAVSGSHGDMVFDSHMKVGYFCLNDLNSYPWREFCIPFTTWKPVAEMEDVVEKLYQGGQELVRHMESGEGENLARTGAYFARYRELKYN